MLKPVPYIRMIPAIMAVLVASAVSAHHCVPAKFDTNSSHTVTGKLITAKWVNPHSQVEVALDDGGSDICLIEMNAINTTRRLGNKMGFTTDDFVVGRTTSVGGWSGRHHLAIYFRTAMLEFGLEIIRQSRLDPDLAQIQQD